MSNLITLENITLSYGLEILLDKIKFQMTAGERVCLIGRNGAGKSTLLKIIDGKVLPDHGDIWRKPALRIARLEQELPQQSTRTVYEFVAEGLADTGHLLTAYHTLTHKLAESHTEADLLELERLQHLIDENNGWQFDQQITAVLQRLDLTADKPVAELSGGWQRRAALARALVSAPELLLLDEPTNHLDISAIQWLEDQLLGSAIGLLFITHDRALLQRLATRIIELDRGNLTSWPGDYPNFLRRKEELLHAEEKHNSEFDKKLAQEEVWIRQGIKARRTRNEGRVRALKALRLERSKRRDVQGKVNFNLNTAQKSGNLVIDAKHIQQQYNHQIIIKDFSLRIMRGDRIGLIGPNGAGKSTLLNILLGNIAAQQGSAIHGTNLQIAYFDQLRQALDLEKTVLDNVGQGSDTIEVNGKQKHVISYLADFLFTPKRTLTPVKALSGGECNRLLLARLFSQPSNVLVLDEPTNDLDIETLELLEELLSNYQGTLLLVSHDRAFLDNVVTSVLVFEGNGKIQEYIGGYNDWLQRSKTIVDLKPKKMSRVDSAEKAVKFQEQPSQKLTYKEQKELADLPGKIEKLEAQKSEFEQKINDAGFYQQDAKQIANTIDQLKKIAADLKSAYQRWETLENISTQK